jgi:hypothetical protein
MYMYVAGVQRTTFGQLMLYCCVTFAAVVDECAWDAGTATFAALQRPLLSQPLKAISLTANSRFILSDDLFIRDIVAKTNDSDIFKVEVGAYLIIFYIGYADVQNAHAQYTMCT